MSNFMWIISFELTDSNGNLSILNGFHIEHRLTSKVVDINSLKCFAISNIVELNLEGSNVNRVSIIFHGALPNLKYLNLSKCNGLVQSDLASVEGVPSLGKNNFSYPQYGEQVRETFFEGWSWVFPDFFWQKEKLNFLR